MDQFENNFYSNGYSQKEPENSGADTYQYGQQDASAASGAYDDSDTNAWYRPYEEPPKPEKPKRQGGFFAKLIKCAVMALVFGLVAGAAFMGTTRFFGGIIKEEKTEKLSGGDLNVSVNTENAGADGMQQNAEETADDKTVQNTGTVTNVSGIVDAAMPSIVSITTIARTQVPSFFFGRMEEYESEGCGSGIIVSQDEENLYIATNNHVVEGAETLTVLFADETSVSAQVKGTDASSDLAVVSVALDDIDADTKAVIRTAAFGDSSAMKVGETAIAIGNALGYGQSVTMGVISALNREVSVTSEADGSTVTNELLQTDAAINPGNSGGALLNLKGEVIGINSVKYSETSVEGMGYAIPSKTAIPIIRQLITRELVKGGKTAYLGISGVDVTQSVSDTYQMPQGVYVAQVVEGSGAANAGITQGDIITRFDGRNIKTMEEMQDLLQYISAGTTVEITVQRAQNGAYTEQTMQVTLGSKN